MTDFSGKPITKKEQLSTGDIGKKSDPSVFKFAADDVDVGEEIDYDLKMFPPWVGLDVIKNIYSQSKFQKHVSYWAIYNRCEKIY